MVKPSSPNPFPSRPQLVKRLGRLLVVEPDPLTRWSLQAYLQRWFDVRLADGRDSAERALSEEDFAALVLADDLPGDDSEQLESQAREKNPKLLVIRTVAAVGDEARRTTAADRLEKPFALIQLARLLGVSRRELPDDRD